MNPESRPNVQRRIDRVPVWKAALIGAGLGAVGPIAVMVTYLRFSEAAYPRLAHVMERIALISWPTGIMMLATDGPSSAWYVAEVFAVSFAANMVLFGTLTAAAWTAVRGIARIVEHLGS